jgi:hypothetical protein
MKIFKKIAALLLVCLLALSAVGCHKKNEIAVTVDGFEFTSAYYMCALINANSEAQNKVYETLKEDEQQKEIDFYSKKIDDKNFVTWVEDRAIEMIKEIAAYKSLCKKANLKLDDETKANAQSYASYYWQSGYSQYFEPNGVGESTYTNFTVDSYYSSLYFEHLYGKDGEKEIAADEVKNKIYDNFITANLIDVTFSEETDSEKTAIETKLNDYAAKLKNKSITFEQAYKEYYEIKDEETNNTTESNDPKPKDEYATVLGAEGTGYEHDFYSDIQKMATGEIKVIKKENNAGLLLVVKQDIKADAFYLDNLDLTARHLIKDKEYSDDISKTVKALKPEVNKYAVKQFKVKKIVEPSYQ